MKKKTVKTISKRVRVTGGKGKGTIMHNRANKRHLLEKKTSGRKRRISGNSPCVTAGDNKMIRANINI